MAIIISPNMNLPIPVVGVEIGPQWASDINTCFGFSGSGVDGHDHSFGKGVPVKPNGLDINSDLTFQGNNGTDFRTTRFTIQPTVITPTNPDVAALYSVLGELYYNDNAGNAVQITNSGSVVGANGNITGLVPPASATYTAFNFTFTWQSDVGVPAIMDSGSLIVRDMSAPYNGTTIEAFSPLTSPYTLILPSSLPSQQSFMTLDAAGHISAPWTVDNSTIKIISNQLVAQASALGQEEHAWELNGVYTGIAYPFNNIDSIFFAPYNITIQSVWIYSGTSGSSGTTEFDLKVATSGGSFTTILSTTGKIASTAASTVWTDSGAIIASQTGVTKPVISTAAILAGQAIRFDLIQSMAGTASDARIRIFYTKT